MGTCQLKSKYNMYTNDSHDDQRDGDSVNKIIVRKVVEERRVKKVSRARNSMNYINEMKLFCFATLIIIIRV